MHRLVMRLRALDGGERAHRPAESFLELQLRQRDLARRLVDLEVRERTWRDAVGLDSNAGSLELGELLPFDRPVEDALGCQVLLVRQRMAIVEVADRDE